MLDVYLCVSSGFLPGNEMLWRSHPRASALGLVLPLDDEEIGTEKEKRKKRKRCVALRCVASSKMSAKRKGLIFGRKVLCVWWFCIGVYCVVVA